MFHNIDYKDKLAFFALLDEYFESRPHLLQGASSQPSIPLPTRAQLSSGLAQAQTHLNRTSTPSTAAQPSAGSPWVAALGNKAVQGALGKLAGGAAPQPASKSPPPPPPSQGSKGRAAGSAGLVQSRTFGHVDTSSGMGALMTMFKDPQAAPKPYEPPVRTGSSSSLPPPPRRTVAQAAPEPEPEPLQEEPAGDYVEALYEFPGTEPGDLALRPRQVLLILEKTSADWWRVQDPQTMEQGLIPSAYVKEC